tara:strand:- start:679 stop:900 length:222 start_codon:yes stop_codon:yes gene_type:complete
MEPKKRRRVLRDYTIRQDIGNLDAAYLPEESHGICLSCHGKRTNFNPVLLADGYCVTCWDKTSTSYEEKPKLI